MANPWGAPGVWTSGRRTYKGNRLVGGVADSDHLKGTAADFAGVSEAQLRKHFGPNYRYLNEGDHIHVSGLKDVPYHGNRGIAGLVNGVDTTAPKGQAMFQPAQRRPRDPITAALGRMTPVQGGVDPLAPVFAPQPPQMAQQMPPMGLPQSNLGGFTQQQAPEPEKKPKAFGKGGAGWAILGAIGDALSAYGGQQGVFAPMMADQMARDQQEKLMREKMSMEAQSRLEEARLKAQEPPSWLRDAQTFQSLPDDQKQAVLGYRDAMYPVIADIQNPDGSVFRQQMSRSLPTRAPQVGQSEDGYVFLGGDPADPKNWSKQ